MKREADYSPLKFKLIFGAFVIMLFNSNISAQFNYIRNGSLNGTIGTSILPLEWTTCDLYSTPDIYSQYTPDGSEDVITPIKDSTFLLLRVRSKYHTVYPGPYTYEYITQRLARPLEKDSAYTFGIFYCFNSHIVIADSHNPNIAFPV